MTVPGARVPAQALMACAPRSPLSPPVGFGRRRCPRGFASAGARISPSGDYGAPVVTVWGYTGRRARGLGRKPALRRLWAYGGRSALAGRGVWHMASTGGALRVRVVVVGWDGGGSFGSSLGLAFAQLNFRCGRSAGFQPFAIHHRTVLSHGAHFARPCDRGSWSLYLVVTICSTWLRGLRTSTA